MNIVFYEEFTFTKRLLKQKTIGGIETNTNNVIKSLRRMGHRVMRNCFFKDGTVPDIVVSSTFGPLAALFLWRVKKKYNCACVQHAHTTLEDLKGGVLPKGKSFIDYLASLYLRKIYSYSNIIITPTEYSKSCLQKMEIKKPIYPISNGIDVQEFLPKNYYRSNFRQYLLEKYNIPEDAKIVLNVGVVWDRKGPDDWYKVAKRLKQYYFVWVGPKNNNKYAEIADLLPNTVFTGFYPDIREAYYGSDLFFFPSYIENQGIPLIEAAITKLPIITRDIEPFNWLEDGIDCYKGNDVDNFARLIDNFFKNDRNSQGSNSHRTKNIWDNAYNKAVSLHDFSSVQEQIIMVYEKAIKLNKKIIEWKKKI